jgi:hypothetical protein
VEADECGRCPFCERWKCLWQAEKHIDERHRHRYEVNPIYINRFEAAGLQFVGKDETGERMEVIENSKHPFFVAAQFHPEFKSRPFKPSPLFLVTPSLWFRSNFATSRLALCVMADAGVSNRRTWQMLLLFRLQASLEGNNFSLVVA